MHDDQKTRLEGLVAHWREQAGEFSKRAQRLGNCRAGEVAATEAGAIRNCADVLESTLIEITQGGA